MTVLYGVRDKRRGFFIGCGYGGPGGPCPYWDEDMSRAKLYKRRQAAWDAAKKFGGRVCGVEVDEETGSAVKFLGDLVNMWQQIERIQNGAGAVYELTAREKSDDVDGFGRGQG